MKIKIILSILFMGVLLMGNADANTTVLMKTNYGDITIELFDDKAPATVENFLNYVNEGFYDQTIFHRVIDGFMIQGGGLTQDFQEKENHKAIPNEASLPNEIGTIAMARTSDPHSATSQFFINVENNSFLNHKNKTAQGYGYAVFGKVISGMDVVNKIAKVKTGKFMGYSDVPKDFVIIESVKVLHADSKDDK